MHIHVAILPLWECAFFQEQVDHPPEIPLENAPRFTSLSTCQNQNFFLGDPEHTPRPPRFGSQVTHHTSCTPPPPPPPPKIVMYGHRWYGLAIGQDDEIKLLLATTPYADHYVPVAIAPRSNLSYYHLPHGTVITEPPAVWQLSSIQWYH